MIYAYVLNRDGFAMRIPADALGVRSPADQLDLHSGGAANFILPRLGIAELFRKPSGQAAGIFEGSGIGTFPAKRLILRAKDYRLR